MQLEKLKIRQMGEGDVAALQALADSMKHEKELGYFETTFYLQSKGERLAFIVDYDGQDVAYCMLSWRPKYAFFKAMEIPEIQDLNVLPRFRRRGIARALIAHSEALARKKGCEHIGIGVGLDASYGAAQKLYVGLGYVPDGHGVTYDRVNVRFGEMRPIDDDLSLMMVRSLC